LSNAVQNAMNGGDNSVGGGLISATTLIGLNWVVALLTFKSKKIERWVEGQPQVIIHNGHLFKNVMESERLTLHELNSALRGAGCLTVEEVHCAILENNGTISVVPNENVTSGRSAGKPTASQS